MKLKLHKSVMLTALSLVGFTTLNAQYIGQPFSGTALQIGTSVGSTARLEFENYDRTASSVDGVNVTHTSHSTPPGTGTYYDKSAGNLGTSTLRGGDVDITDLEDESFNIIGQVVSGVQGQEYQLHTVNVVTSGKYTFTVRYAHGSASNKTLQLFLRNASTLASEGTIINEGLPNTGNSSTYGDFVKADVELDAGTYVLQPRYVSGGPNYDYIDIKLESETLSSGNIKKTKLSVTPNPSEGGVFTLAEDVEWEVYTILGQSLLKGSGKVVDISSLSKGKYFIKSNKGASQILIFN